MTHSVNFTNHLQVSFSENLDFYGKGNFPLHLEKQTESRSHVCIILSNHHGYFNLIRSMYACVYIMLLVSIVTYTYSILYRIIGYKE